MQCEGDILDIEITSCWCARTAIVLLYEYRDLFIDMDMRNNRSELAIANRHQER